MPQMVGRKRGFKFHAALGPTTVLPEKALAPHCRTLAWKIPWWAAVHGVAKSRTRLSDFTFTFHLHALEKAMAAHSSTLAWRVPGTGSLVGCRPWGRTESHSTEATAAAVLPLVVFAWGKV